LLTVAYRRKAFARQLRSSAQQKCQSLYIFGEVGRGKSMLMDLFYEACPLPQKRRVYFHTFMLEVHAFIHQAQQRNQRMQF